MDPPGSRASQGGPRRLQMTRQASRPSIGIRRRSSIQSIPQAPIPEQPRSATPEPQPTATLDFATRRRSSSEPRPVVVFDPDEDDSTTNNTRQDGAPPTGHMPTLREEANPTSAVDRDLEPFPVIATEDGSSSADAPGQEHAELQLSKSLGARALDGLGRSYIQNRRRTRASSSASQPEYDSDLVNLLDVIDPEVATLSTLTNVQNFLFVPDLGSWINRRPTYNLSAMPARLSRQPTPAEDEKLAGAVDDLERMADQEDLHTIRSSLSDSHYAVLPHGITLDGWTDQEKDQLNDHVRHMLHSRRAAFKRGMKGFGQYVRRPLGAFVTIYAFLLFVFGLAWVLFLIGWINLGERRDYIINIIDNVLVALFAIVGDGLIPWRIVDTYHMIYIAHYHHLTWHVRKKAKLPKLPNHNDLPTRISLDVPRDLEAARAPTPPLSSTADDHDDEEYLSVLTPHQQQQLNHHQLQFSKSHTFYKPHETETHSAFPRRLLVAIVVILDFHSIFQLALGICTWSIDYKVRPVTLTTVLLCCSLACNATGGVLISMGDKRTRKKEVRERMFRQDLTREAMGKVERRRRRRERERERKE
ncbi:hypothetical protein BDZ85DRAFT_261283 [Elsinoe ampelina]|uniref:Integral membrane protein n=1 Tax=Elsinoe ampelina TaxID=302913 RepID=A0A6A6GFX9_9PEZI|nr:hypothetical protein BDZ85DRAFT_261283 [Elsinoe ampelina]